MSECGIDLLRESLRNHDDCAFKSATVFYFQFYVVLGQKNTMILPCAHVTMPDKKTERYIELIEALKLIVKPIIADLSTVPYFPPEVLTDFEQAFIDAFRHCFPGITIKGCYLYFKHAHLGWLYRNGGKTNRFESNRFVKISNL